MRTSRRYSKIPPRRIDFVLTHLLTGGIIYYANGPVEIEVLDQMDLARNAPPDSPIIWGADDRYGFWLHGKVLTTDRLYWFPPEELQ